MTELNKSGVEKGWEVAKTAKDLADKQAKYDASLQAKQDRKAAKEAERLGRQLRGVLSNRDEKKGKGFFDKIGDYVEDGYKEAKEFTGYDKAMEIAREELAKRGRGNHNNEGDAMRHAEWSRRMTEEIGPMRSWAYGTAHEVEGLIHGQPMGEAMMDLHNNAVGRAAGRAGKAVNRNDLQKSPKKGSQYNPYGR